MKKILMFAALAGIAAAVSIYFVTEANKTSYDDDDSFDDDDDDYDYVTDADIEAFDLRENTGRAQSV